MTEAAASIPENSQEAPENEENPSDNSENVPAPPVGQEVTQQRKRGRPAGSKDRVPRRRVRVEPIDDPEPPPPAPDPVPTPAPKAAPKAVKRAPKPPVPVFAERERSPSPPSPGTLYRQTSEHLVSLRDMMNSQKRAAAIDRYTSRLHSWV